MTEITGNNLTQQKLWYSLKYDQGMVMAVEGDANVRMFLKGNDKHGSFYVAESDGLKRHAQKASASCAGRTQSCDHGAVYGRSRRDRDHSVQEGRKGLGLKRGKLADTYNKIGCIVVVECYNLMLGEYSVELTNSRKLLVTLGQQTCACRQWQMLGILCCHALAVAAKANLWVYDYVHLIYKTATQQLIYNQLADPMETHEMGTVDGKTRCVVDEDDLDDNYDCCILAPNNERQPDRPLSKRRESQTQGIKSRRCSKCGEVGHTRRTCLNPRADFDASYEGNAGRGHQVAFQSVPQFTEKLVPGLVNLIDQHPIKAVVNWVVSDSLCSSRPGLPLWRARFTNVSSALSPEWMTVGP
ncbi:hypothetical protein Cgig2_006282 [Carnegiea gigantea]|uniref:SWIM-type domain-containing protein n=1 Tax=Carnegiea gigantea TaxID=171969 RepID=A0A9Q1JPK8_9CARY|nr:hypothetical protein Cgig2_006282 [Carnegiea gigantea]